MDPFINYQRNGIAFYHLKIISSETITQLFISFKGLLGSNPWELQLFSLSFSLKYNYCFKSTTGMRICKL